MWLIWSAKKESSKVIFDFLAESWKKSKREDSRVFNKETRPFALFCLELKTQATDRQGRRCFFQKISSFRKRAHVFSLEKEHTKEQSRKVFSYTHRQILLFWGERLKQREQSKKSSFFTWERAHGFFTRESAHKEKSKSLLGNTQQTDFDRRSFASFKKMSSFLSFLQI